MKIPLDLGVIHFIGIGGIGMSGIAELLQKLGYQVQGSDLCNNANVERLRAQNIPVFLGHDAAHIANADVVVVSSAISVENVEYKAAKARHLPIVPRAEMLAGVMRFRRSIAIAGTHGKTTTTSLVATLLEAGHFDPLVVNGGIINAYGTNARFGYGDWMVVEADESDGSFLKLPADIVVVTNIDPEHLDHYGNFNAVKEAFVRFIEQIPFYGFAVVCVDHENVRALTSQINNRRVITYGQSAQADVQYVIHESSMDGCCFDVVMKDRHGAKKHILRKLVLPMLGAHNIANATAAVAIAYHLGVEERTIAKALGGFSGVKRRFTHIGSYKGSQIFDDYGHHPVEIKAVLEAARAGAKGRVLAVVQPHRFTRLRDLFDDFATCLKSADKVFVLPVYAAGEKPIPQINADTLVAAIRAQGQEEAYAVSDLSMLVPLLAEDLQEGDFIICLGAGDITHLAQRLPRVLEEFSASCV